MVVEKLGLGANVRGPIGVSVSLFGMSNGAEKEEAAMGINMG